MFPLEAMRPVHSSSDPWLVAPSALDAGGRIFSPSLEHQPDWEVLAGPQTAASTATCGLNPRRNTR